MPTPDLEHIQHLNSLETTLLGPQPNKWVVSDDTAVAKAKEFFNQLQKVFWISLEINFAQDSDSWKLLTPEEQHLVKHVLAFFVVSDGLIVDNISTNFMDEITHPQVRQFYALQEGNEAVHAQVYNDMLDVIISDRAERHLLFNSITTMPCIAAKCQFVRKWMDREKCTFVQRLVAFAAVEGIFFSGGFLCLTWLRNRKDRKIQLLPGATFANEWIQRDENIHTMFAAFLYAEMVKNKLTDEQVYEIIANAVEVEDEFFEEALKHGVFDLTLPDMKQFVRFMADRLLQMLGHPAKYKVANPFDFMRLNDLDAKINFFEGQTVYVKTRRDEVKLVDNF